MINSKIRLCYNGTITKNKGNIYISEKRENQWKKENYCKTINQCCMPGCIHGYNLNVHHIIPIKKGGSDTFDNYIVLCAHCHHHSKIHRYSEEHRISLLVYKFYKEGIILGCTSDDYTDQEFMKKLKEIRENIDLNVKTKIEESKSSGLLDTEVRSLNLEPPNEFKPNKISRNDIICVDCGNPMDYRFSEGAFDIFLCEKCNYIKKVNKVKRVLEREDGL